MARRDAAIEEAARRFALLSDPTRLRILSLLVDGRSATVAELAGALEAPTPNVSQHLGRLLSARVVTRQREGRTLRYSVCDPTLVALFDIVCPD